MTKYKITLQEPEGPLRTGLRQTAEALGPERGGHVFMLAHELANAGLDLAITLEERGLGDRERSIPPAYHHVQVERKRGKYEDLSHQKGTPPTLAI